MAKCWHPKEKCEMRHIGYNDSVGYCRLQAQGLRIAKEVGSVNRYENLPILGLPTNIYQPIYRVYTRETNEIAPQIFVDQVGDLRYIDCLFNSLVENPEDYVVKIIPQEKMKEKAPVGLFPVWERNHGVVHLARQRDGQAVCGVRKLDWDSTKSISDESENNKKLICIRCQSILEAEMQSEEKRNRNGKMRKRRAA